MIISKNGEVVEAITLQGNEPEFTYGYGVFETLRTYAGVLFMVEEHLDRLENSAYDIDLELPFDRSEIERWLGEHVQVAYQEFGEDVRTKIILGEENVYMLSSVLEINPSVYKGVSVTYQELERESPSTKQLAYWREYQAYKAAQKNEHYEVVLLNRKQEVLEGSRSNIFIVRNDVISTPRTGILKGITRDAVIELAGQHYEVKQRKVRFSELLEADEIFLTQTSTGVVPITKLDERKLGKPAGRVGPITKHVMELYNEYTQ